jgi:hypothetical protein
MKGMHCASTMALRGHFSWPEALQKKELLSHARKAFPMVLNGRSLACMRLQLWFFAVLGMGCGCCCDEEGT